MVKTTILREPTSQEAAENKPLLEKDHKVMFRNVNVEKQQDYAKIGKPYCFRCAKLEYEDVVEDVFREATRKHKLVTKEQISKIFNGAVEKIEDYSNPSRFKHTATRDAMDIPKGRNYKVKIGDNFEYTCKERGCRITIFKALSETASIMKPEVEAQELIAAKAKEDKDDKSAERKD